MPLKPGKSNISANIGELMRAYEKHGKIGKISPRNKKHAQEIAAGIAYSHSRGK